MTHKFELHASAISTCIVNDASALAAKYWIIHTQSPEYVKELDKEAELSESDKLVSTTAFSVFMYSVTVLICSVSAGALKFSKNKHYFINLKLNPDPAPVTVRQLSELPLVDCAPSVHVTTDGHEVVLICSVPITLHYKLLQDSGTSKLSMETDGFSLLSSSVPHSSQSRVPEDVRSTDSGEKSISEHKLVLQVGSASATHRKERVPALS